MGSPSARKHAHSNHCAAALQCRDGACAALPRRAWCVLLSVFILNKGERADRQRGNIVSLSHSGSRHEKTVGGVWALHASGHRFSSSRAAAAIPFSRRKRQRNDERAPEADAVGLVVEVEEDAAGKSCGEVGQVSNCPPQCLPVADEVATGHGCVAGSRMEVHQHIEALRSQSQAPPFICHC